GIYRAIEMRIGLANTIQSYRLQKAKRPKDQKATKHCVSLSRSITDSFIQSTIKTRIYKHLIPERNKSSRIKKHYRQGPRRATVEICTTGCCNMYQLT
ncbi:MAG: hypothetical protein L7T25_05645, partial [Gammaproteobacteria bacterium]|nr:hypothetical protein [Gammaproteobacteria bacterium]